MINVLAALHGYGPSGTDRFCAAFVRFAAGCACLLVSGLPGMALAAERDDHPLRFDIPSQSLEQALEAYSATSGLQVLYDSNLGLQKQSSSLHGSLEPLAALQALLKGTDLVVRYTEKSDVVLAPATATDFAGPVLRLDPLKVAASDDAGYRGYVGVVATEIQTALYRNPKTRSGRYHVGLKLWLAPSGAILRSAVDRSTGDRERDAAIVEALGALVISKAPPAEMPLPINIRIVAHPQ